MELDLFFDLKKDSKTSDTVGQAAKELISKKLK